MFEYRKRKQKNTLKISYTLGFLAFTIIGILLMIFRWGDLLTTTADFWNSDFQQHLSNFSISLVLYLVVGFGGLVWGVNFRYIIGFGALLAISNVICETLFATLNTVDIADGIYGIVGTTLVFLYLLCTKKWGFK